MPLPLLPLPLFKAIARRALCVALLPALGFAIYASARLSVADSDFRANTDQSVALAVRLDSGNAAYHQLNAEHLESAGRDPLPDREAAALLSPLDSRYWIDLGVLSEVRNDLPAAERYYLKAASVDHTFAPRFALMNFYFRRHQEAPFWRWAREALPMVYDDPSAVFRLCWLMTSDTESIRRLLPRTISLNNQYLEFLINDAHWDAAPPVARDLAARAAPDDLGVLLDYMGRGMTRDTASVVEVWNTLSQRGLQHYAPLSPAEGAIVTNGDFRISPVERGFDWRLQRVDGVSLTLSAAGLDVELTGEQPVAVTLLNEWVPIEPGRTYRIEYLYNGDPDDPASSRRPSGLAWRITHPVTTAVIARSPDLDAAARDARGYFDFSAPAGVAMLSLTYERAPGTVRRKTRFTIRKVASRIP